MRGRTLFPCVLLLEFTTDALSCRAIDYQVFGPLVFPLLKLYFTKHPFGGGRCLLDTVPDESKHVTQRTGLKLYKHGMFCKLSSIRVTEEECGTLLGKLRAMVDRIVEESPHPFDRSYFCHKLYLHTSVALLLCLRFAGIANISPYS